MNIKKDKLMENIFLKKEFKDVNPKFRSIDGGENDKKSNVDVSFKIIQVEQGLLQFKVRFRKHPQIYPFLVFIEIETNDQVEKFLFQRKDKSQKSCRIFNSHLKKDFLSKPNASITYTLQQLPPLVCTLLNPCCICYLNSTIQLLFHLSEFRSFIELFSIYNNSNPLPASHFIFKLNELFNLMLRCNKISPEELTKSFGWPSLALQVQHDASEFLYCFLDNINTLGKANQNKAITSRFDSLFQSHFEFSVEAELKTETQFILITDQEKFNDSLFKQIKSCLAREGKVFTKFPEILLIQTNAKYGQFEDHLDLSPLTKGMKKIDHCTYTLSGLVIRIGKYASSGHYKCVIRANTDGVWYYFNDDIQGIYTTFNEGENIQTILNEVTLQAKEPEQARILLYIADDVINDHLTQNYKFTPKSKNSENEQNTTQSMAHIITEDDVIKYVNSEHTDFKNIKSSLCFTLAKEYTKSRIYDIVAEKLKVPRKSFVLRLAGENNAPSCYVFQDNETKLNTCNFNYYLYYEPIEYHLESLLDGATVPIYFLSFVFDPIKFIRNLEINLTNSYESRGNKDKYAFVRSAPVNTSSLKLCSREDERPKNYDDLIDRNRFTYVKHLTVETDVCLDSLTPQLLKALGKPDDTEISYYIAKYDEMTNTQVHELNKHDPINKCFQINTGRYIYIQCTNNQGEPEEKNDNHNLDNVVDMKFLFFKYFSKALGVTINPKSFLNVFKIENFSIPVTICQIDDHLALKKTLLFPLYIPMNLEEFYKFICAAMNEEYNEKKFIQVFLSFGDKISPFTEKVTNMKILNRALEYSLFNTKIQMNKIHFNASSEKYEYENESDTDFVSNVYFYYKVFDRKDDNQISLRTYYSSDAVNIYFMSQVLIRTVNDEIVNDQKVSYLIDNIEKVFTHMKFDDFDKEKFIKSHLILKISNCKISGIVKPDYSPSSNLAIRFDKRQPEFDSDDFLGFIPVYYGAKFKIGDYQTSLMAPFGTPFLLPVMNEDLKSVPKSPKYNMNDFKETSIYRRLTKNIRSCEDFSFYVVNYDGLIQNINIWELEKLLESKNRFKLHIVICINTINAASFLDEENFFKGSIKILS
ncbi:hypothetical protein M9Y10_026788 [Tritrichomonas musculus]|uniref:USP domain-containing protein n=1 Tax=Tritrichomonas musculus TaxID=1915356 RepID=A0ABR2H6I7_9EUKA